MELLLAVFSDAKSNGMTQIQSIPDHHRRNHGGKTSFTCLSSLLPTYKSNIIRTESDQYLVCSRESQSEHICFRCGFKIRIHRRRHRNVQSSTVYYSAGITLRFGVL